MPRFNTSIGDAEVTVEYTTYRGYAQTLEEPGEPGGAEIQGVEFNGRNITNALTEEWISTLEERACEDWANYDDPEY